MKIYNKLVLDMRDWSVLSEDSFEYSGPLELAAGGMLTKQADQLTARYLNAVNDAVSGGTVVSVPTGAPSAQTSATQPGDRIVLDDATAFALSDPSVTQVISGATVQVPLFGGVYMYVKATSVTRAISRGCVAFFKTSDIGLSANSGYNTYSDVDPTAAHPSHVAGIYIFGITSGNYGWIQVAGAAPVQFADEALTSANDGAEVTVKISTSTSGTKGYPADAGASVTEATIAAHLGVACGLPSSTVISTVMLTRGLFCGRI